MSPPNPPRCPNPADITKIANQQQRQAQPIPEKRSKRERQARIAIFAKDMPNPKFLTVWMAPADSELAEEFAEHSTGLVGIYTPERAREIVPAPLISTIFELLEKGKGGKPDTYALILPPQFGKRGHTAALLAGDDASKKRLALPDSDTILTMGQKTAAFQLKYNPDECRKALQAYKLQFRGSVDGATHTTEGHKTA